MPFPCTIARPSCSRVKRSRTIALGVARLQNGPAPLQNAFAALFHVLAVVRGAIARLFRRLFWWLWSSVASSSSAGIPHLFQFRAEGVGSADNVKLSPASPMILHLLVYSLYLIILKCSSPLFGGRLRPCISAKKASFLCARLSGLLWKSKSPPIFYRSIPKGMLFFLCCDGILFPRYLWGKPCRLGADLVLTWCRLP